MMIGMLSPPYLTILLHSCHEEHPVTEGDKSCRHGMDRDHN